MTNDNVYLPFTAAGAERPAAPFLTEPGRASLSYGALTAVAEGYASAFAAAGARPGDRALVQVAKCPEAVAVYLAALRLGLVYVPLNTAYTAAEVDYVAADAAPRIAVLSPEAARMASPALAHAAVFSLGPNGAGDLAAHPGDTPGSSAIATRSADDVAAILYTSGTTGRPKGAMLTHANLLANARELNRLWAFGPGDVLLHALPIFHIHGLFVALHTAMLSGAEVLFLRSFDVAAVRAALARASVMMGVPTFYTRLLAEPDFGPDDARGVRLFVSGSAPLSAQTHREFHQRTGAEILERYGMTEAGIIASHPLHGERRPGDVGFPLPGVEVRFQGSGNGPGEIEIRGPNVFAGYWNAPDKTAEAFTPDGWFRTGDIGVRDAEGRLAIVGRAKDLIIVGGFNVYPAEIEEALAAVPGVGECAVIAAPHPDLGEGVVAVLAPKGGAVDEAALAAALKRLAAFKRPRRIYWETALPRNAMGKIEKGVLRRRYADAFSPA